MSKSIGYSEALSSRPRPSGKKELRSIEIEKAKNGGHTASHRFHSNGNTYHEPEEYVFGEGEGQKLVAHLEKHLGIKMKAAGGTEKVSQAAESEE